MHQYGSTAVASPTKPCRFSDIGYTEATLLKSGDIVACKWLEVCPLRRLEEVGKLNNKWRKDYCESEDNWKNCMRYQLEESGKAHPDNMLPDGKIEKGLE